jgi:hypothetical protein
MILPETEIALSRFLSGTRSIAAGGAAMDLEGVVLGFVGGLLVAPSLWPTTPAAAC